MKSKNQGQTLSKSELFYKNAGFDWRSSLLYADSVDMTGAINNLASSLAGAPAASKQASKVKASETFDKTLKRRRIKDEYNAQVEQVEHIDAVRNLEDADQEAAREDRQEHETAYRPPRRDDQPGRLDLNA